MLPPPHRRYLLILGNGAAYQREHGSPDLTFAFNAQGGTHGLREHIDVQMTRDRLGLYRISFKACGFETEAKELQAHVNHSLEQQTHALGCLPSTGYALLHGLWSLGGRVVVDGICFNPSLERPRHLSMRRPLAQAFHNWLGERRISFQRWLTEPPSDWTWPMIAGADISRLVISSAGNAQGIHHSEVLDALRQSSRIASLAPLAPLVAAKVQPGADLLAASTQVLELEGMFHLQRNQSDTPNWWLYYDDASALIDQLAGQLRLAQYLAFRQLLTQRVVPD
ncbi:MAG: hypothetical protein K9J82_18490 [Methylotenera sp.]|jgi:hypothetical protein|nr:hypothetical protein [Methylotenera sp.]